jgi:hypothetical protein
MPRDSTMFQKALILPLLCCTGLLVGQIENGSFEEDGIPLLAPWIDQCNHGNSFLDAPPGGGEWCLELEAGNTQGCFPAYVYQLLPNVEPGQNLTVRAQAFTNGTLTASLLLGKMDLEGQLIPLYQDTTSANSWTQLEVSGEMDMSYGEVAAVFLQGGLTGGPVGNFDFGYFDLVEIIGGPTSTDAYYEEVAIRFPNPVEDHLPIWTADGSESLLSVHLFSASGQALIEMQYQYPQSRGNLYLGNLPAGPYFLLIYTNRGFRPYWVLRQ